MKITETQLRNLVRNELNEAWLTTLGGAALIFTVVDKLLKAWQASKIRKGDPVIMEPLRKFTSNPWVARTFLELENLYTQYETAGIAEKSLLYPQIKDILKSLRSALDDNYHLTQDEKTLLSTRLFTSTFAREMSGAVAQKRF